MIDPELIHRAQQGDRVAMGELLQYAKPKVRGAVVHVVGPGVDADDVIQLALIKIWRKLDLYHDGNFDAWIRRIALFTAYDYKRADQSERLINYDDLSLFAGTDDPAKSALVAVDYATLLATIDELTTMYQSIIRALYVEQLSMMEAAEKLAIPMGTVKSHSFRGRKALASLLRTKGVSLP